MGNTQTDSDVMTEEAVEYSEPKLFRVIYHNDNTTTFMFVIDSLKQIFNKDHEEAFELTIMVHEHGSAVVGIYSHEIAEQKVMEVTEMAIKDGFTLKVTFEEEL